MMMMNCIAAVNYRRLSLDYEQFVHGRICHDNNSWAYLIPTKLPLIPALAILQSVSIACYCRARY